MSTLRYLLDRLARELRRPPAVPGASAHAGVPTAAGHSARDPAVRSSPCVTSRADASAPGPGRLADEAKERRIAPQSRASCWSLVVRAGRFLGTRSSLWLSNICNTCKSADDPAVSRPGLVRPAGRRRSCTTPWGHARTAQCRVIVVPWRARSIRPPPRAPRTSSAGRILRGSPRSTRRAAAALAVPPRWSSARARQPGGPFPVSSDLI